MLTPFLDMHNHIHFLPRRHSTPNRSHLCISINSPANTMKFSIIAVALFAVILGNASPLPLDETEGSAYTVTTSDTTAIITDINVADDKTAKLVVSLHGRGNRWLS
jgi:hypothetical protein